MHTFKIIIFHPMQQHSYKTAEALIDNKMLYEYWTSIYYDSSKGIYKLLKYLLSKNNIKRMLGRNNDTLTPYVKTCGELLGLCYLLSIRIDNTNRISECIKRFLVNRTGHVVAKRAIRENVDAIIVYDTWAYSIIKALKKRKSSIKIIMDSSSLYAEEICQIINKDIIKNPESKKTYRYTLQSFSKKNMKLFKYEKDNVDYFLSPSTVVDRSLCNYGININQIFRCTYGSYFRHVPFVEKNYSIVRFIYIGRMSYAKGVHYLLNAFNSLKREDYELILIGEDTDNFICKITNSKIKYMGFVHHDEISKYLKEADVVVSASLYDGFSLAILEAAAYNLPILCTEQTGAVDCVIDGKTGISFESQDSKQIIDTVNYLLDNKKLITYMSRHVGNMVERLTWDNYYKSVQRAVEQIKNNI